MNIWDVTEDSPFCQVTIDARRMSVLQVLFERWKKNPKDIEALKPCYIWYDKPDTRSYGLRFGDVPPDIERPQHLKGKTLHINLGEVVDKIMRVAKDTSLQTNHDASIAIAKLCDITLPAFAPGHVESVRKEPSRIITPNGNDITGLVIPDQPRLVTLQ